MRSSGGERADAGERVARRLVWSRGGTERGDGGGGGWVQQSTQLMGRAVAGRADVVHSRGVVSGP